MERFLRALLMFALLFYIYKVGPSWFLSLYKVAWVLRGLLATLAFRFCFVPARLLGLYYDYVFAFDYFGWIGMQCWETSQYLPCVVVTFGMSCLP